MTVVIGLPFFLAVLYNGEAWGRRVSGDFYVVNASVIPVLLLALVIEFVTQFRLDEAGYIRGLDDEKRALWPSRPSRAPLTGSSAST